jgi:hypothetical protein
VLDGSIGDEFLAMLDGMDLVGLSWFDAGVRSFYTREKVTGLDDLQGLTIRVQESDMMSDMITALGAKPAQVVYSKVYAALHNAEIDGAENNWPSYEVMGHYEVAPFFLKDEHTRVPEVQLASPAVMEKLAALDESFPEVIRACARESAQTERELSAGGERRAEYAQAGHLRHRTGRGRKSPLPRSGAAHVRPVPQPRQTHPADSGELKNKIYEITRLYVIYQFRDEFFCEHFSASSTISPR